MHHISNMISENENIIKPHKNADITQEKEDDYAFASLRPNYIYCFKGEHSIFRGGISYSDRTNIVFIVTEDIEKQETEEI